MRVTTLKGIVPDTRTSPEHWCYDCIEFKNEKPSAACKRCQTFPPRDRPAWKLVGKTVKGKRL